jgi:phosphohistidine phosphatase
VLVIGHQPTLGQLAATLVTGSPQDWTIRKGNVWWIVQRERGDISGNYVRAVMAPDLLAK